MVKNQVMPSDVTNKRLLNAMFEIPREKFVPPENIAHAYNEIAIPVACGREIIESRFLGKMIDTFDPNPNELIFRCWLRNGLFYSNSCKVESGSCYA